MKKLSDLTLKKIKKTYEEESLYLVSEFPKQEVEVIPTGALLLDEALGVGGIPKGRVTEIYGPQSVGKTTLCQHIVANAQAQGDLATIIDVEHALDIDYARRCGVKWDELYLSQPNFAKEALGVAEILIESGEADLIIIDSIASLSPEKESEGEFEDKNVTGMQRAKLLNVFFRRVLPDLQKHNVALVLTNQMRDNTNSFWGGLVTMGGHGVKYYSSVRIKLWRDSTIEDSGQEIGQVVEATIKKNRVAPPFKKAKFSIVGSDGIDKAGDVLNTAVEIGVIQKRASYYKYKGDVLAQGEANTIKHLKENPELVKELDAKCRDELFGADTGEVEEESKNV
jgi:recombination protein RecA